MTKPTQDRGAAEIIERLGLAPHPEGGWYRETWRAPVENGGRGAVTSIHFLLEAGQRSHWHRVDATEIWLHQAGGALTLSTARGAEVSTVRLGPDITRAEQLQAVVEPGHWQAAEAGDAWVLVACVVAPAFAARLCREIAREFGGEGGDGGGRAAGRGDASPGGVLRARIDASTGVHGDQHLIAGRQGVEGRTLNDHFAGDAAEH
jgi:predicted cupin superfamily sugar epimerase